MGILDFIFGSDKSYYENNHQEESCDLFDMTKNYYGKHGEFDRNDEERGICEDMYGMHSDNPDADLEYHYGWENKLNYDTDGYSDDEDL